MKRFWHWLRLSPAPVRILIGLAIAVVLSLPLTVPLYRWEYANTGGKTIIWVPIALFLTWVVLLPSWLRGVHHWRQPWRRLGFYGDRVWWLSGLWAFGFGVAGVALLYLLQIGLGWSQWVPPTGAALGRNLLEGLLVGIGIGLAEELLFRGWMLCEFEQDYALGVALWVNAIIFAIAHFLRPLEDILATWPQFVGLLLLGMTLVWARRIPLRKRYQSAQVRLLAPAIGLHGGLVFAYYQVDVNDLAIATGVVPEWITGIGGNPLAGLMGLGLLGAIAVGAYRLSRPLKMPKRL